MAKAATQIGCTAHLPEQPRHDFSALGRVGGHKGTKFLGQVQQYGAGFKHPHGLVPTVVHQSGDFGVGVDANEATAELIALIDANQPGIVFGACNAQRQQLFQHHGDFDTIRRCQ